MSATPPSPSNPSGPSPPSQNKLLDGFGEGVGEEVDFGFGVVEAEAGARDTAL